MRKKSIVLCLFCVGVITSVYAQSIYDLEKISTEELTGSARYVGMGGAMNALGGDLSTINNNPATLGMFRRSEFQISLEKNRGENGLNWNYVGGVYTMKLNLPEVSTINLGFSYKKNKNLFQNFGVDFTYPGTDGASMSWQMKEMDQYFTGIGNNQPISPWIQIATSPSEGQGHPFIEPDPSNNGKYFVPIAKAFQYRKNRMGDIGEYAFNLSTNIKNRYFLGLSFGISDIDYSINSTYIEKGFFQANNSKIDYSLKPDGEWQLLYNQKITGTGINIKLGGIVFPFENSPFRIGLSISSPTFYTINNGQQVRLVDFEDKNDPVINRYADSQVDFQVLTPWKYNLSIGHTLKNRLALGAEYEYQNLGTNKVFYDRNYTYYANESPSYDKVLKAETEQFLKGLHTFKMGVEAKVSKKISLRAGYNYVSQPFSNDAFYNQKINSPSIDYASQPSYLNLSAIHRYTCGVGFSTKSFYADLSWQWQKQKGYFNVFHVESYNQGEENKRVPTNSINLDLKRIDFTLGLRF